MDARSTAPDALLENARCVRRIARAILTDEHAAEDVAQEVWRRWLGRPASPGAPGPWLATVARHLAFRRRRDEARRLGREQSRARPEAQPSAHESAERAECLERVARAVRALPEPYRTTVLLRFYEDLPPRAIARRMGVPVETVRTRVRRACAQLRAELVEAGGEGQARALASFAAAAGPVWPQTLSLVLTLMKTKAAIALTLVVLCGLGWWWGSAARGAGEHQPESARPGVAVANDSAKAALEPGAERAPLAAAPTVLKPARIAGRVVDEQGTAVAGARVHVMAESDPFPADSDALEIGLDVWRGRTLVCDADGRFRASLRGVERVLVALALDDAYEAVDDDSRERWVAPPAEDLLLRVRRVPTAALTVRARRAGSTEGLRDFRLVVSGPAGVGYRSLRAEGQSARLVLPVRDPQGIAVDVRLYEQEEREAAGAELRLAAGEERELLLLLEAGERVAGFVVDEDGAPIAGALVHFGEGSVARGDEPFRAFDAKRVPEAVTTAADGYYEIEGVGRHLSAWHAEHSPATVRREAASRIVLARRARLRGRLLGRDGRAAAGVVLRLDDKRAGPECRTDEEGRFAFDAVEAGAHGLWLERNLLAGVRLAPGEEAEVELALEPGGALELELLRAGEPFAGDLKGLIVGTGRVFTLVPLEHAAADGSRIRLASGALDGEYLLVSAEGRVGRFLVEAGRARVELGGAPLRVRAAPGSSFQLVPREGDAFLRLIAARMRCKVGAEGERALEVQPGDWLLVGEAGTVLAEVTVPAEGAEVELP